MLKMIKKGDIVARISYHKDVIFVVDLVIDNKIAILTGITIRLKADSPVEDLEVINKKEIDNIYRNIDEKIEILQSKVNAVKQKSKYKGNIKRKFP